MRTVVVTLWLVLATSTPGYAYELHLDSAYPIKGEPVAVTLTDEGEPVAGASVHVQYRPNSQTTSSETLAATNLLGSTEWRPADAGIVTLEARLADGEETVASLNVAVRFGVFPVRGIVIVTVAGLLLFGGATFGFLRLLQAPHHLPAEEPPST